MKKIFLAAALTMIIASTTASCVVHGPHHLSIKGSGVEKTGTFAITPDYTAVEVSNAIKLVFVPAGTAESATGEVHGTISADEEAFEHVSITRDGGTLVVEYRKKVTPDAADPRGANVSGRYVDVDSKVPTVVTIPLSASLTHIEAVGAAKIEATERIALNHLTIEEVGASNVTLDIDATILSIEMVGVSKFEGNVTVENFKAELVGASNCDISGLAQNADIETIGASEFSGYDLVCRVAKVEAVGASNVKITATESLTAEAIGASSVHYKGDPASVKTDSDFISTVKNVK